MRVFVCVHSVPLLVRRRLSVGLFECSTARGLLASTHAHRHRVHTHTHTPTHARSRTRTHAHRYIPGVFEKHSNNVGGAFCLLVCLFACLFVCLVVSSAVVPSRDLPGKSASCDCIPKVF